MAITKLAVFVGAIVASFGRAYCYVVLRVVAGSKYDNSSSLAALQAMCVYQLFLGECGLSIPKKKNVNSCLYLIMYPSHILLPVKP